MFRYLGTGDGKMKINLRTEEKVELVIDGTCEFEVCGKRNEEGTMVIEYERKGQK